MSAPGFGEIIVILIVALIVFGPRKLPEIGRSVGQAVREFRRATSSLRAEIEDGLDLEEQGSGRRADRWRGERRTRHPRATTNGTPEPTDGDAPEDGSDAVSTTDRPDPGTGDGPD